MQDSPDASSLEDPQAPARILVIDDDPQMRELIRAALTDEGLTVETAADGRQALQRAARRPPTLVVLVISLPGVAGYEVATRLRTAHGAALPILVITADGRPAQKAQQAGAYGYLTKPFDLDALLAAVQRGLTGGWERCRPGWARGRRPDRQDCIPFGGLAEQVAALAMRQPSLTFALIPGADHFCTGTTAAPWAVVERWLAGAEQGAGR
jgi:DNA-binding response OmpR family regulator